MMVNGKHHLQFYRAVKDIERYLLWEDVDVHNELCGKFSIYNPNTIVVTDEPILLDLEIRQKYIDVYPKLQGLAPRPPYCETEDFRIRLLPGSKLPSQLPYRLTLAEHDEYQPD
jgi:hypothetical protein